MLRTGDEVLAIATEHGFALWIGNGNIQRGWCLAMLGRAEQGIALSSRGSHACRDAGCGGFRPFWLALLAEVDGHVGRFEEALERLAEADRLIETTGEAWFAAEVHRLRGQIQ